MRNIWVISDTHFLHKNILTFKDSYGELIRGSVFDSIEEHDETMIDNWNKSVKSGDIVYHLGDVFMGSKEDFKELWGRLNGRKRLILGNHDDAKFFAKNDLVSKVVMWRMFKEYGILLTHVPVHNTTLWEGRFGQGPMINVHGHIHHNPSPSKNHKCVCVEHTKYSPINIEELSNDV